MALLSPSLFREFILPRDRRILSQFPFSAFHLHASALWAVADLVHVPDLDVVELNHESACIDEEATFEAWTKIQEHKPLVIWKEYDGDRFWSWLDRISQQLTARGLLLHIITTSFVEALKVKQAILAKQW